VTSRAAGLREAFDRSFAAAPQLHDDDREDLLGIAVAGEPYALRLSAVAELVSGRAVTRLVGGAPGLLGIAGLRGALVPVFDLAGLLGRDDRVPPRWLALTSGEPRVALAFAQLDGHLRVARDAIAADADGGGRRHVQGVVRAGDALRPIVHVASILATLAAHAASSS
jgi:purine-binding chemotaxis protein CheW